jgi:hypothetical protein
MTPILPKQSENDVSRQKLEGEEEQEESSREDPQEKQNPRGSTSCSFSYFSYLFSSHFVDFFEVPGNSQELRAILCHA